MNELVIIKRFVVGPLDTNCYVLHETSSGEVIVIDPGAYDKRIEEYIERKDIGSVSILNTHGHADHIMADGVFGWPILIHKLDEPYLCDPLLNLSGFAGGSVLKLKAHRLLDDGDVVRLGPVKLETIHTPGHTPGGISVKYDEVLFSGDSLFREGVGRTDLEGGDWETLARSIKEKLFILPDTIKVYPGHGPETTIGHEKRHNPFLSREQ